MNNKEFSAEFDIMFNNIMSNQAPGISLYEKSVFLTKAQNDLVTKYFMEKDYMLKREFDFSTLIRTAIYKPNDKQNITDNTEIMNRGIWFDLGDKPPMFVLNERMRVIDHYKDDNHTLPVYRQLSVRPISMMEYNRLSNRIDKNPPKNEVWRLYDFNSRYTDRHLLNIIYPSYYYFDKYEIKFVDRPRPIILEDLSIYDIDGKPTVSVDGEQKPLGVYAGEDYDPTKPYECCELPEQTHRLILDLAVAYCKQTWND